MPRKRSLPITGSVLSNASTESASTSTGAEEGTRTLEGWMYWKRDEKCWTKVFVVLRKHLIWLMRSDTASSLSSALIQMAVNGVERTTLRSFLITGPSNESMELHLYNEEEVWTWFDALVDAASYTRSSIDEREKAKQDELLQDSRRSSFPRLTSSFSSRSSSSLDLAYRGTLVVYNQERQGSSFRKFWRSHSQRIKASLRKHVEGIVDRYETSHSRPTLC